jgi:hypothetical protein
MPTTIGALLSVHRHRRHGPPSALQRGGDVGPRGRGRGRRRQATEFKPLRGVTEQELADAAQLASLADETPEGRSTVVLAKERYGIRGRDLAALRAHFIPFADKALR